MPDRNPKNAPGPFYVMRAQCISCDAPRHEAPGLITLDNDDPDGCYFHRQPETEDEVDSAIEAMRVSCIESYRYGGQDPTIRRRLAQLGSADLCDHPLEGVAVSIRTRLRFSLAAAEDAVSLASDLVRRFESRWQAGKCTRLVEGDEKRATFGFATSRESAANEYVLERTTLPGPQMIYRSPANADAWLLSVDEVTSPHRWLRDVLDEQGASAVRWFSRAEWLAGSPGHERPF